MNHTNLIKDRFDPFNPPGGLMRGFQPIEALAQLVFLGTLAVVPRTPLKPHHQNIVANEMRSLASA